MRIAKTALALALLLGCSDPAGPSPLLYRMPVLEFGTSVPVTAASPGDSLWLGISLEDSTSSAGSIVTIRATCATNITVLRGATVVTTVPTPATCPDSVYQRTVGTFPNFESRFFRWDIPPGLAPGTYTLRGELLQQPRLDVSITLPIN